MNRLLLFGLLLSSGATAAQAQSAMVVTVDCLVRVRDEIQIPAPREGLVASLRVRRGSDVQSGQQLGTLDRTDALLHLAAAKAEYERTITLASNEGRVRAAEAASSLAKVEAQLIQQLGADAVFLERARVDSTQVRSDADLVTARGDLESSRMQVQVRKAELDLAQRDVDDRQLIAPLASLVREISRQENEWVRRGETVIVLTRMDRLLVEAFVDSRTVPPHRVTGANANVRLEVAEGELFELPNIRLEATGPRVELDGKYLVWTEIENLKRADQANQPQWVLRPGMKGKLVITICGRRRPGARPSEIGR